MTAWNEALDAAREEFIDGLEQRGFSYYPPDELTGAVQVGHAAERITVRLEARFPFAPPAVFPTEEYPRSWHRELNGAMCLYPQAGREALPWLAPDQFIKLVSRWFEQSRLGWPEDAPDLDLNRYFHAADDDRIVLYSDIDSLVGRYIRLRRDQDTMAVLGTGSIPARAAMDKKRAFGFAADIGEPAIPPHDWSSLLDLLDPDVAHALDRAVRDRRIGYLLVAYRRQGHQAVLALETHDTVDGVQVRSLASAPTDPATLRIRSGTQADELQGKNVLLLGAGSVGSFLADALQRAGLGNLTIRDGDVIRPGNLVRHLVGLEHIGRPKAVAVRSVLTSRPFNSTVVQADPTYLRDPSEVPTLLEQYDLVIDATADAAVTPMLNTGARTLGHTVLNVCVKDEGRIVRVDVVPPLPGGTELADPPSQQGGEVLVFEAGCGDPVSLTPPYAVCEAAQVGARHAIGLLLGQPVTTSGELRDYRTAA